MSAVEASRQPGRSRAVVLLSGGLDSATVLALARERGHEVWALSVHYGQRHSSEIAAASRLAGVLGAREHRVMGVVDQGVYGMAFDERAHADDSFRVAARLERVEGPAVEDFGRLGACRRGRLGTGRRR